MRMISGPFLAALAVFAALVSVPVSDAKWTIPSPQLVRNARQSIRALIQTDPGNHIPGFVRLAFHDCCSSTCDACIDTNAEDNKGLANRVTALNGLYDSLTNVKAVMSRADFWMLAMVVALEQGNGGKGIPGLSMRFGRSPSPNCPTSEAQVKFPAATNNGTGTFAFFKDNFGLSKDEVVALLGVHTLGKTRPANSGFTFGPWVPPPPNQPGSIPIRVNNAYYRNMANVGWRQTDGTPPPAAARHYQWTNRGNTSGFLNADMALLKDFSLVDASGQASCTRSGPAPPPPKGAPPPPPECKNSTSAPLVRKFANDQQAWLKAFGPVLTKMIERNAGSYLEAVTGATAPL